MRGHAAAAHGWLHANGGQDAKCGVEGPGLAALLDGAESGFEAVLGSFVFFAEGGGALVEAGFFGFTGFEEA